MKNSMKSVVAVILAFVMTAGSVCCIYAAEDENGSEKKGSFEEKEVPVFKGGLTDEMITIRYYEETPNVPYVGIKEFYDGFIEESLDKHDAKMSVEKEDDGTYLLKSAHGEAKVDVEKGVMSSDNMADFTNLMCLVQEDMTNCYVDGLPYTKVSEIETTGDGSTEFDFAEYGIDIYGDDENVYFPVAVLSNIFTDLVYHYAVCNGETFYFNIPDAVDYEVVTDLDPDYTKPVMDMLDEDMNRPEDLAEFSYKLLCFSIDHFYGLPGKAVINDEIEEKGLVQALTDYGEEGEKTIELLKSANLTDYMMGLEKLQLFVGDAGHTMVNLPEWEIPVTDDLRGEFKDLREELESVFENIQKESDRLSESRNYSIPRKKMRDDAYKGEKYIKEGDTAVFVLDSFMGFDMDKWNKYYKEDGLKPSIMTMKDDDMLLIDECMRDADKDPDIKNFVIDISNNGGGSLDEVAMLCSLITGKRETTFNIENSHTGQKTKETYEADINFDREFNEDDERDPYDLNFAVLTSPSSFSCGNAFPAAMKDLGYLIMGEQSGGGGCAVLIQTTGEGFTYRVSAYKGRLVNEKGESIDNGVPVDVDLIKKRSNGKDRFITVTAKNRDDVDTEYRLPDCSDFYDIDRLSEEVNKYYSDR
ncbi:MAG: hypothetical protein IK139_09140 [Lachnospiraceae bacterium]|nr:hypothetical protein [Lachnospiraceae bacterium]